MSQDATGLYSGWAFDQVQCPVCKAAPKQECDLTVESTDYVEHDQHWSRVEAWMEAGSHIPGAKTLAQLDEEKRIRIESLEDRKRRILRYWDERDARGGPSAGPAFQKEMSFVRDIDKELDELREE